MIGARTFRLAALSVGAASVIFVLSTVARAAPAATDGPAYGVEPGDAPKNSVAVGAAAPPAAVGPKSKAPAAPATPAKASAPAKAPESAAAPTAAPPPGPSTPAPAADAASVDTAAAGSAASTESTQVSDNDPRALSDFRPQLDPYGAWVEDPKYGTVWVPDRNVVGEGFSPYVTSGHWALDTANNWVWVSDFPFGDVVFHYGRWVWTGGYGWSWVPGYVYSPAWVVWRVPTAEYAYVGWAPAPPLFLWWGGVGMSIWWGAPYYWAFCPSRFVFSPYTSYYVVHDRAFVRTLAGSTRRYVSAAPRVAGTGPGSGIRSASSPSLDAARVPRSAAPAPIPVASGRVPPSRMNALSSTRTAYPGSTARSFGSSADVRSTPRAVSSAGQRSFSPPRWSSEAPRTFSSSGAYPRAYTPPARTWSPSPRSFSSAPDARAMAPRAYSPPARTYSAPQYSAPRAYSAPVPRYSAPSRVYSPSPRVYSSPAPAYRAAPTHSPSFSAPHFSGGGGGRHR